MICIRFALVRARTLTPLTALGCILAGTLACTEEETRHGPKTATATASSSKSSSGAGGHGGSGGAAPSGTSASGGAGGLGGAGGAAVSCTGVYTDKCAMCMEAVCCIEVAACKAHEGCINCLLTSVCLDQPSQELAATALACAEQLCKEPCFEPPGTGPTSGPGGGAM